MAEEMDERVFEARWNFLPRGRSAAELPYCLLKRLAIGAGDMNQPSEHRRGFNTRRRPQPTRRVIGIRDDRFKGYELRLADDLVGRSLGDDPPFREVDDAVAALRLIHVVGRHQSR